MTEESKDPLELLFSDETFQLTGVAVSKTGRLFTCYPRWPGPHHFDVVEIFSGSESRPFPNVDMNSWKDGEDGKNKWVCVQAVYVDDDDFLWVVDPACPNMEKVVDHNFKVVKFNLATNTTEQVYRFRDVLSNTSYINDIRVDTQRQFAYLTNSNEGGLVIINLQTGQIRQVLRGNKLVKHDPLFTLMIDGKEFKKKGKAVHIHADGIALTPDGEWLYFKPLTDNKLYRIETRFLRDEELSADEVEKAVKELGKKAVTDGMTFDKSGNLWFGDYQNYKMVRLTAGHDIESILVDERLIWPDSYAVSDNGFLYISCSQINKQPDYNEGQNKRTTPYTIYRMKLLA